MKRLIITGASGFVGRHALPGLRELGFEVCCVGRSPPPDGSTTEWRALDLLDRDASLDFLKSWRPTHLLHLAWCTEHGAYWNDPQNLAWAMASLRLAEAFVAAGGRRMVVAGSCAEYDWRAADPTRAPSPPAELGAANTPYGKIKAGVAEILAGFALATGVELAWGRIFFPYGPHERPQRLVPSVINALLDGRPAQCTHGRQVRDFMDVRDCGRAFALLADSGATGVVEIGTGRPTTIAEVAGAIAELVGRPDLLRLGALPARPDEPASLVADPERLRAEAGFAPRYDLRDGLAHAIDWWRRQRPSPSAG